MPDTLATTMADRLDHHMFERYREIKNIAAFPTLQQIWEQDPDDIRRTLELVQSSLPEYAWLGFATPDGNVRSATKGMLEGVSVASRPWFVNGMKDATVEDVHDAKLLDKLLRSSPEQEPFRFVHVAIPVKLPGGKLAGVLGAHMSWSWAEDVRRTVLSAEQAEAGADVWILSRNGEVLLGPKDLKLLENTTMDAGVRVFTDPTTEGGMRTAIVPTKGYQDYPGLGWQIAARKPVAVIYAPASRLVWQILAIGGAAVVVAWLVAGTVARPLQRLSQQLDSIGRRSDATSVERQRASKDVLHLSSAIRSLLRRVGAAEAEQQSSSSTIAALKLELENQAKASEDKTTRFGADLHALRILSERVENQGKGIVDLRSNMNMGFRSVNARLTTLSTELRSNSKTQWPVIWAAAGVCFTVLATGGAFFYNSLSKGQDRLDSALMKNSELQQAAVSKLADTAQQTFTLLADKVVTRKELEWRTARGQEDRARMEANVADIRAGLVPRAEHERVWQNYTNKDQDLQRQLDEVKEAQGSVYGARDVILDLRQRLDRVERERVDQPPR